MVAWTTTRTTDGKGSRAVGAEGGARRPDRPARRGTRGSGLLLPARPRPGNKGNHPHDPDQTVVVEPGGAGPSRHHSCPFDQPFVEKLKDWPSNCPAY